MNKSNLPKQDPERWLSIKFQLELIGYSFASLAREIGVSRTSMTSTKRTWLYKNQKAIAEKLLLLPHEIWPERYGDDGRPLLNSSLYPRKKSTTSTDKRQRKIMKRFKA
jgi:lambda repressor-like predicted transcriptional regulator